MAAALEYARSAGWLVAHLALALVPIGAGRWARVRCPRRQFAVVGVAAGAVASPFSLGLYGTFFIPLLGFIPGMLGLALAMLHGSPGFYLAIALGLLPRGVVVHGIQDVYVETLNGTIWGVVYGMVGALVDRWRAAPSNPALQPTGFAGG